VVCGAYGDLICNYCCRKLPRLVPPICQRCGKPEASANLCSSCWATESNTDLIRSAFIFNGSIRAAIYELKYNNIWAIAEVLGELMADYYIQNNIDGDVLCPVPVHKKRMSQRGFNQSQLLAQVISDRIHIPIKSNALIRTRHTHSQTKAENVYARKKNVENVFECKDTSITDKSVVLIDDVCTSGATIDSCALALKMAGAKKVIGFTLARELLNKE
jgi:competence protein ComFC